VVENLSLGRGAGEKNMVKILGRSTSGNVQKVVWLLEELGQPYTREDYGRQFNNTQTEAYLKLNPSGKVPTLVDGEVVVWESNTILRYLCSKSSGGAALYPTDPAARTHVERWMDWQLSVVGGPMGQLLFGLIRTKPEALDHAAIEAARRRALSAWTIVEDALADRPYLAGSALTLAEVVLGTQVYRWFNFPIERPALPNLRAWYDRIGERPGFKSHIEVPIT
jgi:glutathione S-transferase